MMRNRRNGNSLKTRDLVLRWLDEHCDEIGIVELSVRELATEIDRKQNTINHALVELKAEQQIVEYTLHPGQRVFRRRRSQPDVIPGGREDSLRRRIEELEELTEHDHKLRPLIEQYAAIEQTIADIDRELEETEPASKERDTLRRNRCQQSSILIRLAKEIGLSFSFKNGGASTRKPSVSELEETSIPPEWIENASTFAEKAIGIRLHPHQQEFCKARQRVVIMIAGRGAGKSTASRVFALYAACRKPNHTVLVISSGQRMSSDFGKRTHELIASSEIKNVVRSASTNEIRLRNGSSILLLPAKPDTIRGYHPHTAKDIQGGLTIILDEACYMEQGEEIRAAVEYALITTPKGEGRMIIASSPSSVRSWVYPLFLEGQKKREDIISFQWPSTVNPEIRPEEVERLRRSRTELEFRAEILAEWVEGSQSLLAGLVDKAVVLTGGKKLLDGETATLGADLALSYDDQHDASALVVLARREVPVPSETSEDLPWPYVQPASSKWACYRVVDLVRLTRATTEAITEAAIGLVRRYGIAQAAVEQYQGKALHEYLVGQGLDAELVAPVAATQQVIFNDLYNLFRQNRIEIPHDLPPVLIKELKAFQYRRESTGRFSFGHPAGSHTAHDDTVYALAWALHAHKRAAGESGSSPPAVEFF